MAIRPTLTLLVLILLLLVLGAYVYHESSAMACCEADATQVTQGYKAEPYAPETDIVLMPGGGGVEVAR